MTWIEDPNSTMDQDLEQFSQAHRAVAPGGMVTATYTLERLEALPTLAVGQTCNLKIEREDERVWLCRCGVADGMPYDHQVTVERLIDGCWQTVAEYQAR